METVWDLHPVVDRVVGWDRHDPDRRGHRQGRDLVDHYPEADLVGYYLEAGLAGCFLEVGSVGYFPEAGSVGCYPVEGSEGRSLDVDLADCSLKVGSASCSLGEDLVGCYPAAGWVGYYPWAVLELAECLVELETGWELEPRSVLLGLLLLEAPDEESEEPELVVDIVPVTLGRLVRDPSVTIADEEPEVSVEIVPVTLERLVNDPSVRVVDPKVEEVDGEVPVRDGWMLDSEGMGIGIIVKFHDELELADHEAGMLVSEDARVEIFEVPTIEEVIPEVWKLKDETEGLEVGTTLCGGLKLPDPEDEAAVEESGTELLTDSDPGVFVSEVCELGAGTNDTVVEVVFDDELWFPVQGADGDVKAGTVAMPLDAVKLSSEADGPIDMVLPSVASAVVAVTFATDTELHDFEPGTEELDI